MLRMQRIFQRSSRSPFMKDLLKGETAFQEKVNTLKNLDLFVLDNSMRETTVASVRGVTIENKRTIFNEVKKCGFKHYIIDSVNNQYHVPEPFLEELIEKGEDLSGAFCFSEVFGAIENKIPQPDIPVGLWKCKKYGINNVVLEIDLNYYKIDYEKFNMDEACKYIMKRVEWIRENMSKDSLILMNFRDFPSTMQLHPERVEHITRYLSSLPKDQRIFGLIYEDLGEILPEELGAWTVCLRNEMKRCGWEDGHLLCHNHEQWACGHVSNLEMLASGATGMWAGVCTEGAGMGHADTCTAIMNLIRLGNEKVQKRYNCKYLREAAINVTQEVTALPPHQRQPVYGRRSLDLVFGYVFSDPTAHGGFDMAEFLGLKREVRLSNMVNAEMILLKLKNCFGEDEQFTLDMAKKMKQTMAEHILENRKEEYTSRVGLAILFYQSGGTLTEEMAEVVNKHTESTIYIDGLIDEVKALWDKYDHHQTGRLSFRDFYDGFMGRYFGCYICEDSQHALKAIDMDGDDGVEWWEFRVWLLWAGREYPMMKNVEEMLDLVFTRGVMPAMMDHVVEVNSKNVEKVKTARATRAK